MHSAESNIVYIYRKHTLSYNGSAKYVKALLMDSKSTPLAKDPPLKCKRTFILMYKY